jgi:hypothetical protein
MKKIRAVFLTLSIYSFLVWFYVVARIIFSRVQLDDPFIDGVPFFSFWVLGAIAFVVSMVFTYLFLTTE